MTTKWSQDRLRAAAAKAKAKARAAEEAAWEKARREASQSGAGLPHESSGE